MEERIVYHDTPVPTNHQAAIVAQPGEGAFRLPSSFISSQFSPILRGRLTSIALMRADQFNPATFQTLSQRIAVVGSIRNQSSRIFSRTATTFPRHGNLFDRRFQKLHFRRTGRVQVEAQRNSLAVNHHHPLRAFAAFGRSDTRPPFFAGAKLPSANASDQSSWPFSSNCPRKARQTRSQTPCSSQSRSRRQQVLAEGYSLGKSCHRAPVRRIQRMPSNTRRLSTGLRPPLCDRLNSGSNGSIFTHCSSVNNFRFAMATPFAGERRT